MYVRRIAFTLLAVGLAAFAAAAPAAAPWSTLAGAWTLDPALSDERPAPGPPPGPPPSGETSAPPAGPLPGAPGEGHRHGGPPPMGGASSLVISVADDGLHVAPDGRRERVLNVDGPSVTRTRGTRSVTETVTWEPPAVVVRSVPSEGPMRTESFSLDANGRLVNAVTMPDPAGGSELTLRFVYDRAATTSSN